jgi:hypothetical protein
MRPLGRLKELDRAGAADESRRRFVESHVAGQEIGAMEQLVDNHAGEFDAVQMQQIRQQRVVEKAQA